MKAALLLVTQMLLPFSSAVAQKVALGGGHNLRFVGKQPARTQEVVVATYPSGQFEDGFSITFWFKQGEAAGTESSAKRNDMMGT